MNVDNVDELLAACRTVTARILARAQRDGYTVPDDGVTLALTFDRLDARIQKVGVPAAWHALLKPRSQ